MREYSAASAAVFLFALGLAGVRGLWTDRSLWLGLLIFGLMTVAADVLLTGIGVYRYAPKFNAGLLIGRMPIEDLAYGLALYLVAVTTFRWDGGRSE
jgi:lycopene cyclase domain-containing protein